MKGIQFDGEQEFARPIIQKSHGLSVLIQKWGLARSDRQAQYILLGVMVVAIVISIFITVSFGSASKPLPWQPPPPGDIPQSISSQSP